MFRFLWAGLFVSSQLFLSAQVNVDSLLAVANDSHDTVRVEIYNNLCWDLRGLHADSALWYGNEALQLAQRIRYDAGEAKAWNNMAIVHWVRGNYEGAIQMLDSARRIYESMGHARGVAVAHTNLGLLSANLSRYSEAVDYHLMALRESEALADTAIISANLSNLGNVYVELESFQEAKRYYQRAYDLKKQLADPSVYRSEMNLGVVHKLMGELDSAMYFFEESYRKSGDDPYTAGDNLTNMASIWRDWGDFRKAGEALYQALELNEQYPNPHKRIYVLNLLATVYLTSRQDLAKVPALLKESTALSDSLRNFARLEDSYVNWMTYHELTGNFSGYREASEQYRVARDSLFQENMRKQINTLEIQYETEQKERQLLTQAYELEQQRTRMLSQRQQMQWLVFALIVVVGLGALGAYVFSQRKKREQQAAVIAEQRKGLRAVIHAQEEERRRIAKDLHDGVVQQLGVLHMLFDGIHQRVAATHPELQNQAEKLSELLAATTEEVRSISHQMMPRSLMEYGLLPALDDLLANTLGLAGIHYQFDKVGIQQKYAPELEITIYRIVQELLNNILKHAQATEVQVQLNGMKDRIVLMVEDNGRGIAANDSKGGIGMLNIRSRIDWLNGSVDINPGPEAGTVAVVVLPWKM